MASADMCEHDWPGSGCKECRKERREARLAHVQKEMPLGTRVRKVRGSEWQGRVVGYYTTDLTDYGIAVESEVHKGSVQIYPIAAMEIVP